MVLFLSDQVIGQTPAKRIPQFDFRDFYGKTFNNGRLGAGVNLFFVFFDTECDHCHRALQYIDQHYSEFKNTAFYLITLDKPEVVKQFMARKGIALQGKKKVTLLLDHRNEFIKKFGPRKYPSLFLYSQKQDLLLYDDNEQNLFKFLEIINR
jgi:peroxiredoxin